MKQIYFAGIKPDRLLFIDSSAGNDDSTLGITSEKHKAQLQTAINLFSNTNKIDNYTMNSIIKNSWRLLKMRWKYQPAPNFQLSAILLKVKRGDEDYGWGRLCNVKVIEIEGTHATMLDESNSPNVANIISKALNEHS